MRHRTKRGSTLGWAVTGMLLLFGLLAHVSEAKGGSVSKRPEHQTNKSKIQMLQSYAIAQKRDPEEEDKTTEIVPDDEGKCSVGEAFSNNVVTKCEVHPLVVAYMEEDEPGVGAFDIRAAVSLDEGATWKRTNLSNNVKRTSTYHGRPCFKKEGHDDGDDQDHDGGGHRILHDDEEHDEFTFQGDNFKPMIVAKGNQILVAWTSKNCKGGVPGNQGEGEGPYGGDPDGADPHNKLSMSDDADRYKVKGRQMCHDYTDELPGQGKVPFSCVWAARGQVKSDGEVEWTKPERLTSGRRDAYQLVAAVAGNKAAWALAWQEDPRGLRVGEASGPGDGMSGATVNHKTDIWYSYVQRDNFGKWVETTNSNRRDLEDEARFSTPVRITDNAACKAEKEIDEVTGEEILVRYGAPYCEDFCDHYEQVGEDAKRLSCITAEGIPLNGDTGASRPNMFLIPEGTNSARVVLAYEESKGLGKGPGDNHDETTEQEPADREDWGKNIYYHTFKYSEPDEIAHGTMVNLPELLDGKEPAVTEDGEEFLTLNARRVRMIVQPKSNWGEEGLAMVLLYREGAEGHGHPAHIIMRRFIGGYNPEDMECTKTRKHPKTKKTVCVEGSSDLNEENTPEPGYPDDARAHRGFLRGDFLVVGYTYTPKWGRNEAKRYDFFVRRSFDGGKKWTNRKGIKEGPQNLSNIKEEGNRGWSVMEPRLYATPGTIKPTRTVSDVQNSMVYYVAYSTTHNPHVPDEDVMLEDGPSGGKDEPMDLYWTMTDNFGETYMRVWNEQAGKWQYPWLAKTKGDDDEAGFAGGQIRTNPAGIKLFASFQAEVQPNSMGIEDGGGPCRGNGVGSDVCSNTTVAGDTLLAKYDLNGDGKVDAADIVVLQAASDSESDDPKYDLNGYGGVDGHDFKLLENAIEEYEKRADLGYGRRTYLRGRA